MPPVRRLPAGSVGDVPLRPRSSRTTGGLDGLVVAILRRDVPGVTAAESAAAAAYVRHSVSLMPDWTRAGVRATALLAAGVARATRASGGVWVPDPRLPVLGELTRLCRVLGLVGLVEERAASERPGAP